VFVMYDTQLIVEKFESGDKDYIWYVHGVLLLRFKCYLTKSRHSVELFIDFIAIFRRLLIILASKVRMVIVFEDVLIQGNIYRKRSLRSKRFLTSKTVMLFANCTMYKNCGHTCVNSIKVTQLLSHHKVAVSLDSISSLCDKLMFL